MSTGNDDALYAEWVAVTAERLHWEDVLRVLYVRRCAALLPAAGVPPVVIAGLPDVRVVAERALEAGQKPKTGGLADLITAERQWIATLLAERTAVLGADGVQDLVTWRACHFSSDDDRNISGGLWLWYMQF